MYSGRGRVLPRAAGGLTGGADRGGGACEVLGELPAGRLFIVGVVGGGELPVWRGYISCDN